MRFCKLYLKSMMFEFFKWSVSKCLLYFTCFGAIIFNLYERHLECLSRSRHSTVCRLCIPEIMTNVRKFVTMTTAIYQQDKEETMKRMKARYASLQLCPRKRSPWETVRSIVMLGQGLTAFS